ncbi:MAG: hypothetical protein ABWZ40_06170 [Caulobacterales bacterium]
MNMHRRLDWSELADVLSNAAGELRKDMRRASREGKELAEDAVESVARAADALATKARSESEEAVKYARSQVEEHPFGAIAAAVGVGALLGILIASSSSRR